MHNWSIQCSSSVSVVTCDVWYVFEAPFTGLLQVNLYFDVPGMLVVYGSNEPGASPCLTIGTDGPAPCLGYAHTSAGTPSVQVSVVEGESYKIRIGMPSTPDPSAVGSGAFQVWVVPDHE
jgi:hypothetical protein